MIKTTKQQRKHYKKEGGGKYTVTPDQQHEAQVFLTRKKKISQKLNINSVQFFWIS